ncbi:MAG TPA: HD domain-containing protein [Ilumatobacteraceae bacterium]|jgi:gamma-butyrobetaine dioxygenase
MRSSDAIEEALDMIERTFYSAEGMAYLGEDVTMVEHQLQAGALAIGSDDSIVAAALLHDIGHVIGREEGEDDATGALMNERDAHHDVTGARWLSRWFGPDVTEPVRLHVAAKRYLVATETGYAERLSEASIHTLRLQGGPMSVAEVAAFESLPSARQAVALRRFDEAAKDASIVAPQFSAHRDLLRRLMKRDEP